MPWRETRTGAQLKKRPNNYVTVAFFVLLACMSLKMYNEL